MKDTLAMWCNHKGIKCAMSCDQVGVNSSAPSKVNNLNQIFSTVDHCLPLKFLISSQRANTFFLHHMVVWSVYCNNAGRGGGGLVR